MGTIEEVDERGYGRLEQKNKFSVGETIEVMKPDGRNLSAKVRRLLDQEGNDQESAPHARQILYAELDVPVEAFDILRRKEEKA